MYICVAYLLLVQTLMPIFLDTSEKVQCDKVIASMSSGLSSSSLSSSSQQPESVALPLSPSRQQQHQQQSDSIQPINIEGKISVIS